MKSVFVVGGGTAGWLTALFVQKFVPDCKVTVIESSQIGVLGAGEGTLPHFIEVLEMLDIDPMKLVRFCDATTKHGIRFTRWNGDESAYFNVFHNDKDIFEHPSNIEHSYVPISFLHAIRENKYISSTTIQERMCRHLKNPFQTSKDGGLEVIDNFAFHFDAKLLAVYLKEIGRERDINIIDDIIEDVVIENNDVKKLLSKQTEYECDIVYDCTGFKRTIISKLNPTWVSYKDNETVNRAIPFILPHNEDVLPPFTEAVAMKYGWCWVIPTQTRIGCGYTFDGNLISDDEAIQEIKETFPNAKIPGKVFEFESGYYEDPWIGNCIAIGLSAGFIEPLEATSIFSSCIAMLESVIMPVMMMNKNDVYRSSFNKKWVKMSREIHDFVYLHYLTNRSDTEFWKKFGINNTPESLRNNLAKWSDYPIGTDEVVDTVFNVSSWYQVMQGVRMLRPNVYKKLYASMGFNKEYSEQVFLEDQQNKDELVRQLLDNDYSSNR